MFLFLSLEQCFQGVGQHGRREGWGGRLGGDKLSTWNQDF